MMVDHTANTRGGSSQRAELKGRRHINHVDRSSQFSGDSYSQTASVLALIPVSTIVTTGRPSTRRQMLRQFFTRHSDESSSAALSTLPGVSPPSGIDEGMGYVSSAPSPHTRPLLSRPVARDEAIHGHLQVAIARGATPRRDVAQFAAVRRDAEVMRISNTESIPVRSSAGSYESQRRPGTAREIYTTVLREREKCALIAAAESRYIREWGFFLKCYAEGRYNLSTPPDPPPRRATFTYLPAPAPPNEVERLKAVEHTDVATFPTWAAEQQKKYVLLARKTFNSPCAAISYVNQTHETLRCEIGYQPDYVLGFIPRAHSLAAHAVLSGEPMVVLDTFKDWRTQGNPLVQGHPRIRFYAAAPLITKGGHHVGAFAIFDDRPKAEFGIIVRRQLVEFAKRVTFDLEVAAMQCHDTQLNAFSLRMDSIGDDRSQSLTGEERGDGEYLTPDIPLRSPSRLDANKRQLGADYADLLGKEKLTVAEDTPPDSDSEYETDRALKLNKPGSGPKTTYHRRNYFSASSRAEAQSAPDPVLLSGPSTPPQSPTRAFSISTNGSYDTARKRGKPPPNTPRQTGQHTSTTASISSMRTILRVEDDLLPAPLRSTSSPAISKRKLKQLPHTPGPRHSTAEASFAAALVAGSLGYDFLYLLRFSPVGKDLSEGDVTNAREFKTKVLVSYGMPNPRPSFDPALHLRALRAPSGLIYQYSNPIAGDNPVEYEFGLLLSVAHFHAESTSSGKGDVTSESGDGRDIQTRPLHPALRNCCQDSILERKESGGVDRAEESDISRQNTDSCVSGVILAGFMRKSPINGTLSPDNIAEMRKLGGRLRELLLDD